MNSLRLLSSRPFRLISWFLVASTFWIQAARAQLFPEDPPALNLVSYNPPIQNVGGTTPFQFSYELKIAPPVTTPLLVPTVVNLTKESAFPLSYLTFSQDQVTFHGPLDVQTVIVTLNIPAGSPAGNYVYKIATSGWPGVVTLLGLNDPGSFINATLAAPVTATPPVVSIGAPVNNSTISVTGSLSGYDIPLSFTASSTGPGSSIITTVNATLDGSTVNTNSAVVNQSTVTWSGTMHVTQPGHHTVSVKASNGAGTSEPVVVEFDVVVSGPAPTVTIANPVAGAQIQYVQGTPSVTVPIDFSASSTFSSIENLELSLDNVPVSFTTTNLHTLLANGQTNVSFNAPGAHVVRVSATDANNQVTVVTAPFEIILVARPVITSANHATFTVGQAGSFAVAATGIPAAMTFGVTGTLPPGIAFNASTGVLSGTPTSFAGSPYTFTITASNGINPAATQVFTLTVLAPPAIQTHPVSQSAVVGGNVTLSVVATGNPAPGYQWRKNGNDIGGANGASLSLSNVTMADAASYSVVVSNGVAPDVTSNAAVLTVTKATATVTVTSANFVYNGNPRTLTATTVPAGLTVNFTYDTSSTPPTNAGTYAVVATVNDTNYGGSGSGTLTITKAPLTVTVASATVAYDGSAKVATATTSPTAGVSVGFTYNGSSTAPTNAGTYPVAATVSNPNYSGTGSGTLIIAKVALTVKANDATRAFGASNPTFSATLSGFVAGQTLATSGVGGSASVTTTATTSSPVGTHPITATTGTLAASNYSFGTFTAGTLTITQADQTITFPALPAAQLGASVTLGATASSGLAVSYTSSNTAIATITTASGVSTLNFVGVGLVTITASQAGNTNYKAATSVTQEVTVQGATSGVAIVRHGITLNGLSGIDGSIHVLLPEGDTLNGNAWISGDLKVAGKPTVKLNGHPTVTVVDGTGAATPTNYTVTLNGNALIGRLVRRTDAIVMPTVAAPPQPTGTRTVTLNKASDSAGSFSTIKHLTINGNVGTVTVPPGTYGNIIVNGNNTLKLGTAGSNVPVVYNLQNLTLNGNSNLQIVGPIVLTLANGVALNGNVGSDDHPEWLMLKIASGGLTLNGNVEFNGFVVAPNGTVILNGNGTIFGGVTCDRLTLNGNTLLDLLP